MLITAKTKIAPIKHTTIPRLELLGALLLAQLLKHTLKHIQLPVDRSAVHTWTDSEIVLYWLRGDTNRWEPFVGNRIDTILEVSKTEQWRHVPTLVNPADCASRGLLPEELMKHPLWWSGPPFLQHGPDQWPINTETDFSNEIPLTMVSQVASVTKGNEFDMIERFSHFDRLLRVTAYIFRFKSTHRGNRNKPFTVKELNDAHDRWVRIVQSQAFEVEIAALSKGGTVSEKSKLITLNPFLDDNGLLRVGGRLQNSMLSYAERHPLILPSKGPFTTLLIREYHRLSMHGGPQLVSCLLRKRYWILNARNTVRFVILKCMICFRLRATAATQQMGNLPSYRVRPSNCFHSTGVDFAGPINVSVAPGRGRQCYKGYIAVFVCMSVKAIHLEVVSDMTTNKFLEALQRFVARRGLCSHIRSDNGTSFVGATNQLKRDAEHWKRQIESDVIPYLVNRGIQWHFNPPGAPEMGGIWESKVKSMKYHLKRCCGDQTFTYEEWSTFTANVEACVNSRPLCPLTSDINDLTALTPGHFLVGEALLAIPESNIETDKVPLTRRFARLTQMKQLFWRRWSAEYLSLLQARPKWMTPAPNVAPGMLVLVKDNRLPPLQWPLGRVDTVSPGKDGLVRVVTVRTRGNVFSRPITKICLLPFDAQPNEKPPVDESGAENADLPREVAVSSGHAK